MNSWLLFLNKIQIILFILISIFHSISSQKLSGDHFISIESLIRNGKRHYGEHCNDSNHLINDNLYDKKCDNKFNCHKNRCKCPAGHGYSKLNLLNYSIDECHSFNKFLCLEDSVCQEVDNNRFCNLKTKKCECNKGFYEKENKICSYRSPQLNKTCLSDADCDADYTHCKNSSCECWPEFESLQSSGYNHHNHNYCTRKICGNNFNCQKSDNPNLICNNTICECEYGYSMDNKRICVKITKRQNCNLTCQIIGGLFASIFMLSLVYWCFYCCYSIVKNYKFHSHSRGCVNGNHIQENLPENQRFTQSSSSPNIVIRRDHYVESSSDRRHGYRYSYYYESENPPTYSQLLDPPPDYETVLNMKIND